MWRSSKKISPALKAGCDKRRLGSFQNRWLIIALIFVTFSSANFFFLYLSNKRVLLYLYMQQKLAQRGLGWSKLMRRCPRQGRRPWLYLNFHSAQHKFKFKDILPFREASNSRCTSSNISLASSSSRERKSTARHLRSIRRKSPFA